METMMYLISERNTSRFKSYYVVWKRAYDDTWEYYHHCLNRTMQYGNDIEAGKIVIFKQV